VVLRRAELPGATEPRKGGCDAPVFAIFAIFCARLRFFCLRILNRRKRRKQRNHKEVHLLRGMRSVLLRRKRREDFRFLALQSRDH